MAVGNIHRPHCIAFPSSVYVTQLTDVRPNNAYQEFIERSSAEPAPQFAGAFSASPEIGFGSRQLKTILDLTTDNDVAVSYAPSGGTVSLYYRIGANRGLRGAAASSIHDRFDMANNAMLFWNTLSAEQNAAAELDCMIKAVSTDGKTAPMVHVGTTALSGDSAAASVYTLGPVALNGAWVDGVVSCRVENGFSFDEVTESGNYYQQFFGIDEWSPRIVIETNDLNVVDDYGEAGLACTAVKAFFRKLNKGSVGTIADGTAENIKVSGTPGAIFVQEGAGTKARFTVTVALSKPDASTQPLIVDTAAAVAL